jgi:hypothetical protein
MSRIGTHQNVTIRYEITKVVFIREEADDPVGYIEVRRTLIEPDGAETPLGPVTHYVRAAEVTLDLATVTTGGTLYDEVRAVLYARLVADGIVPADATDE